MKLTKTLARKLIFPALYSLKVDHFIRFISPDNLSNLMYHGLTHEDTTFFSRRNIEADQFEKQVKYLRQNFDVISCNEAFVLRRSSKKLRRKTITISFDDGLRNNLTVLLPIIEKYELPITIFVSGLCCMESNDDILWAEKVDALKYFCPNSEFSYHDYRFINFYDQRKQISLSDLIKILPFQERDIVLNSWIDKFDIRQKMKSLDADIWKLLDRKQVVELANSKYVTIGSHGHNHYNMANIDEDCLMNELLDSKKAIEDCIGKKVDSIAFPDGSYNKRVLELAFKCGYDKMFAVNLNKKEDSVNECLMQRHGISTTTTYESNIFGINFSFFKGIKM